MKSKLATVFAALCLMSVLALAANVSAEERAIQPGGSYSIEVEISTSDMMWCNWQSDVSLNFVIEDPGGTEYDSAIGETSYTTLVMPFPAGTYTLTWTNPGLTLAHLTYDLSGSFGSVEEGISTLVWAAIIGGIIVVAVIVIIVIVVVMGGRRQQQPVMAPQQQQMMMQQALATGHCPTCGNQIDPNAMFCSRCGTRFR